MKKELVFCAPLRRQYYTQISKKNYDSYMKKGISSNKFWGDIFEDMIYRDWFYGCYVEDQSFDIGYCFSLEIDSQEVKGFQKYFTSKFHKFWCCVILVEKKTNGLLFKLKFKIK